MQNWQLCIKWEHIEADKDYEILQNELLNCYIDEKSIDWKTRIESKEKFKERVGHSPDLMDTLIMRMLPYVRWEQWLDYASDYLTSIIRNG